MISSLTFEQFQSERPYMQTYAAILTDHPRNRTRKIYKTIRGSQNESNVSFGALRGENLNRLFPINPVTFDIVETRYPRLKMTRGRS